MKIPRIIHQIWYQGIENMPIKFASNVASIKTLAANWQYNCWDEHGLYLQCQLYSKECGDKFISYKYMHQKMDLARYVLLYNFGGAYIDMDCVMLRPLDVVPGLETKELIVSSTPSNYFENAVATGSGKRHLLNNGIILSAKGSVYIKQLIEQVIDFDHSKFKKYKLLYKNKQYCIMKSTGPFIFTSVLTAFSQDPNVLILDYDYFEPCYSVDSHSQITSRTIINHQHELSWMSRPIVLVLKGYFGIKHFFT
jgi:mannosyltransferase OCH1-like enzyme